MGLLDKFFGERRAGLASPSSWLLDAWGGQSTASGTTVTHETALRHPAVFRAGSLISSTVGQLPLKVYRRLGASGDKVPEPLHRLYPILHHAPNAEMTALEFREALQGDLCLYGNAFGQIERDRQGRVVALWPLQASKMQITRDDDRRLLYRYQTDTRIHEFAHEPVRPVILHLRAFSADGIVGRSPIQGARESIGAALASDEYGARFFGSGAAPGGVLQGPRGARLTEQAHQRLRSSWEAAHRGVSRAHRVALLEDGWSWNPISVGNRDSQWIESRQMGIVDIARLFGLPPWMLFEMGHSANYSNVEQQAIDFTREIGGWLRRWESQIDRSLLSARTSPFFSRFTIEGLLRGDIATRYQAYATGRQWGWLSINDVRRLEDLNAIGPAGDDYMEPLNMAPAGLGGAPTTETPIEPLSDAASARLLGMATGELQ